MGAWGTAIKSNDTSADIYEDFFELFNDGAEPKDIYEKLISKNKDLISNTDDANNFWLVIALCMWETKTLSKELFTKVETIIKSGEDLIVWKKLGADKPEIKKRTIALDKFLLKISEEKLKAKARKKKVSKEPIFKKGTCLTFTLQNGNYGGAVVLEADKLTGYGYNLIVTTRFNSPHKPSPKDLEESEILTLNYGAWNNNSKTTWYLPNEFKKKYFQLFEVTGELNIEKNYTPNGSEIEASFSSGWHLIIESMSKQIEHELDHPKPKSYKLKHLLRTKKWWQF